ncbi:hypothetical protein N9J94_05765 [Planktomarina sp.]|nr:hypothetical protein [Planktomarina sp.]MDA9100749.1 hypothetical protein [Planktomarina sp.]
MFKPVFDHNMFAFLNERRAFEQNSPSLLFRIFGVLLKIKFLSLILGLLEFIFGFLLALQIPVYKDLIYILIKQWPGLPSFFGMYLRAVYYKRRVANMEPNVFIDNNVTLGHPENYTLREFCFIDKNVTIMSDYCTIGRRVHIAPNNFVSGGGSFQIDDYAGIATGCNIITATAILEGGARCSGPMASPDQMKLVRSGVHIGKDAFVCTGVTLLTGVSVAAGSVVGAGVILEKSTEPWAIYVGTRPTMLKKRDLVRHPDD